MKKTVCENSFLFFYYIDKYLKQKKNMLLYLLLIILILTLSVIYILNRLCYLKDRINTLEKVIMTLLEKSTDENDVIDEFLEDLIL